jgi:hypothetical protein
MNAKNRYELIKISHRHTNAITECSRLLAEKLWKEDMVPSDFVLAGLADAILAASKELEAWIEDFSSQYENLPEDDDQESGMIG